MQIWGNYVFDLFHQKIVAKLVFTTKNNLSLLFFRCTIWGSYNCHFLSVCRRPALLTRLTNTSWPALSRFKALGQRTFYETVTETASGQQQQPLKQNEDTEEQPDEQPRSILSKPKPARYVINILMKIFRPWQFRKGAGIKFILLACQQNNTLFFQ